MSEALLELSEAIAVGTAGTIRADGLVPLHIIRPGIGRGRGKHLYEARMLEEAVSQGRFKGWKMFVDHQSPEAKKAQGGLPRSVRDLGGIVKEAWWDPNVPADPARGWAQGAVVGLAKPTRLIASLIEDDPDLVEASISATATSVKPVQRGRDTVWLVEGIRPRGSVDWVTEAGAGGKVAPLIEALVESADYSEELEMLEGGTATNGAPSREELAEWIAGQPDLLEAAIELAEAGDDEGDNKFTVREGHNRGGNMDGLELLEAALESDEGSAFLDAKVRESFARVVAPSLRDLVEAAIEDERELVRAEGRAESERIVEVRDLRDYAVQTITEARLPDTFKTELLEQYAIVDGKPTPKLDVVAEENEETGAVVKSAEQVLREELGEDIARKQAQAREIGGTRVRGQGETGRKTPEAAAVEGGEEGKKPEVTEAKSTGSPRTDALLEAANIEADEDLYAGILGAGH